MFKILVADNLAEEGLNYVRSQPDAELVHRPGLNEEQLTAILGEHDGMMVRSGVTVSTTVLSNPGRLKVIARAGAGVDNIDLDTATACGILVLNCAEANTTSTTEHTFALLLALARNIGPAYQCVAQGGWDRSAFVGQQLAGQTLGIAGLGRIGQAMAKRALAFDMQVIAYDPFINAATALDGIVKMYAEFDDMLPHADILTFHVPLNDQTRGMLCTEQFDRCRPGVLIVNASRGSVVDEDALLAALDSGKCAGAALDVFTLEPLSKDSPLRTHPKVLATPHLAASTHQAQQAVSITAAQNLLAYLRGQGIRGAVNASGLGVDLDPLQQRFAELAQRMAQLISPMITRGIAAVTIEFVGSQLAPATGVIERTALVWLLREHLDVPLNLINVSQVAEQRGIKVRAITIEEEKSVPQLTIEIQGQASIGDAAVSHPRRIVGRVFHDLRPRVVEINGYHMDMIPAGDMLLIQNEDRPGMVGLVGTELGSASVNISDMAISRRDATALMVLNVDTPPNQSLIDRLRDRPGILTVAGVKLPDEAT